MNLSNISTEQLLSELDALRISQNLSFQNVADACNVSQSTVIRAFKRKTEPTLDLLQKIAATVGYEPHREPVILEGYTQDAYVDFLQRTLATVKEENSLREARAEARHNMLINQKTRTIRYLAATLFLFAVGFITWLIIDVTHPDIGWFQRELGYYTDAVKSGWTHLRSCVEAWFI